MKSRFFQLTIALLCVSSITMLRPADEMPATPHDSSLAERATNPLELLSFIPTYQAQQTSAGFYHFTRVNSLSATEKFAGDEKENLETKQDNTDPSDNTETVTIIVNEPNSITPTPAAMLVHTEPHPRSEVVQAFLQAKSTHDAAQDDNSENE